MYLCVFVCLAEGCMHARVRLFCLEAKVTERERERGRERERERERERDDMMPAIERETAWPMDLMGYFRKY